MGDVVIAGAVVLGLLADQLMRVPGRPGLGVSLWAIAAAVALWLLSRRRAGPVARESMLLAAGALAFGLLVVLRDAEALAAFCALTAVSLLGLAAGRAATAWAARMHFVDLAASAVRVGVLIAMGPLGWSIGNARAPAASQSGRRWPQHARMVARGTVMAVPPLMVLTALLASADPVFERVLHNAVFVGIEPMLEHLAFAGFIAWVTSGYLRAFLVNDDVVMDRVHLPRPAIAPSEISIALSLLSILFIVFLVVQVRYLFGGADLVEITKGLTYAEYARRGFFELVVATALVVPVLLVADWAAREDDARGRRLVHATSALIVVLLFGVLASAAYRMWLYQDAYGLTEDRLYGTMFMVWLTVVLALLAATVLRGKRSGFAFKAVMAGGACIVALHVINPHALIARVNIDRAGSGSEVDAKYLRTLSADAVPTLVARMPALSPTERCEVTKMFKERWSGDRPGGWRAWNLGDARARSLVLELPLTAECRA
jgi:hypothetical protein